MRHLDLFSGIGGFAYAAQQVWGDEHKVVAFCEIDKFCQKVLKKHWPDTEIIEDVRTIKENKWGTVDLITGGFPCQDLSFAGNCSGINGKRSGLWKELCNIIGTIQPRYSIMENVSALLSGNNGEWFRVVLKDLAEVGYDVVWHCIQAANVGAPHRRDRIWIIAYPKSQPTNWAVEFSRTIIMGKWKKKEWCKNWEQFKLDSDNVAPNKWWVKGLSYPRPLLVRNDDGIPNRVDRLKALGNAIVPQVAMVIMEAIKDIDEGVE